MPAGPCDIQRLWAAALFSRLLAMAVLALTRARQLAVQMGGGSPRDPAPESMVRLPLA